MKPLNCSVKIALVLTLATASLQAQTRHAALPDITKQKLNSFTEEDARLAVQLVRERVKSGTYSLKGYGTAFGLTAVFVTLVSSLNPASLIRMAGLTAGSLATLGFGYWLMSTHEAQTGTLADPYLRDEAGMMVFLNLPERQQMSILRGDRRLVQAIHGLGLRARQLDSIYAQSSLKNGSSLLN